LKASYLLGGYVGGGILSHSEAREALADAVSRNTNKFTAAMQTVDDALRAGEAEPIIFEQLEHERQQYLNSRGHSAPQWSQDSEPHNDVADIPSKRKVFQILVDEFEQREEATHGRRRRISSTDFASLSVLCSEHNFSDKARVGLQALIALSQGKNEFQWKYEQLYPYLRRYDPELLKKVKGKLDEKSASRINQIVRGYLDSIDRDQGKAGVCFAKTHRGDMHYGESGKEVYTNSETCLHILELLDLIDSAAKANPSYARNSRKIRQEEARKVAYSLTRYLPPSKREPTFNEKVDMGIKRAGGNLVTVINLMRGREYHDWAIRERILQHLPVEAIKIVLGDSPKKSDDVDSSTLNRGSNVDHLHFGDRGQGDNGTEKGIHKGTENNRYPLPSEVKTGPAIWRNKDFDQPVIITGDAGVDSKGRRYVRVEDSQSAVPLDEIVYGPTSDEMDIERILDEVEDAVFAD
jgi:hypothetical protein